MKNEEQLIKIINKLELDDLTKCEISLYLLDLHRNYINYRFNRKQIEYSDNGVYHLKRKKFSRKFRAIKKYILYCYLFFLIESDKDEEFKAEQDIRIKINNINNAIISKEFEDLFNKFQTRKNTTAISSSCLYLAILSPDRYEFKKMNDLIHKIDSMSKGHLGLGALRKKINEKTFCSCYAIVDNRESYYAFSGGWDNENLPNESRLCNSLASAKDFIENAASEILGNATWCTRDDNMKSYEFRGHNNIFAELGDVFKNNNTRMNCINKHFSCCERKILSKLEGKTDINVEMFVTFNPCSDCDLAISNFINNNRSVINVFYSKIKNTLSHFKTCDLYKKS